MLNIYKIERTDFVPAGEYLSAIIVAENEDKAYETWVRLTNYGDRDLFQFTSPQLVGTCTDNTAKSGTVMSSEIQEGFGDFRE